MTSADRNLDMLICFKFGMILNTTELYSLIPVSMTFCKEKLCLLNRCLSFSLVLGPTWLNVYLLQMTFCSFFADFFLFLFFLMRCVAGNQHSQHENDHIWATAKLFVRLYVADIVYRGARVEDDDEYNASASGSHNYYTLAHTVAETVTEQASIMVNGKLKEYQVSCLYMMGTRLCGCFCTGRMWNVASSLVDSFSFEEDRQ